MIGNWWNHGEHLNLLWIFFSNLQWQWLLKLRNVGNPVWVIAPNTMLWSAGHSASFLGLLHLGEWWLHLPRAGGARRHCTVAVLTLIYVKFFTLNLDFTAQPPQGMTIILVKNDSVYWLIEGTCPTNILQTQKWNRNRQPILLF